MASGVIHEGSGGLFDEPEAGPVLDLIDRLPAFSSAALKTRAVEDGDVM
jgi:hypothetical protein